MKKTKEIEDKAVMLTISAERDFCERWTEYKAGMKIRQKDLFAELINNPPETLYDFYTPPEDPKKCIKVPVGLVMALRDREKLFEMSEKKQVSVIIKNYIYDYMNKHPLGDEGEK